MNNRFLFVVIILYIIISINICYAQQENTKSFLFLSVFCEESDVFYETSSNIVEGFSQYYERFTYECTKPLEIPVDPNHRDSLMANETYTIQLFKIKKSSTVPAYYILKLEPCDTYEFSFAEALWIRISGYQKSDLKVFFDAIRDRGMKKRDIVDMVKSWQEADELFCELDWDCLLNGYFKNNTQSNCYVSGAYLLRGGCYKFHELDDVFADFSKKPFGGTLFKFD